MTFTSYAQNFEDVMLWRALKHVEKGQYVDIGAQDPIVDSVSKAFYELGWRGVHIEPVPHYAAMLRKDRPDEIVLEMAISDRDGVLELNMIAGTGLSTGVKAYAESHRQSRGFEHQTIHVPMLPIRSALASLAGKQVHWLKIDIEGLEEQALRGWDSRVLRPWIMVVEATVPLSTQPSHEGVDKLLDDADYEFVYFDGLNRFYVAREHGELVSSFSAPPNVFDEVELSGLSASWCSGVTRRCSELARELENEIVEAEARATSLAHQLQLKDEALVSEVQQKVEARARQFEEAQKSSARISHLENQVAATVQQAQHTDARATAAEAHVHALLTSSSWRAMAPLRLLVSAIKGQLDRQTVDRAARLARRFGVFHPARAIYRRFRGLAGVPPAPHNTMGSSDTKSGASYIPSSPAELSSDARNIFNQLQSQRSRKAGNH
ncbi:FkbM family methyltransferase [Variovorax sp. RT4R15]|uniref:FkbM family methyltransferase n=1 Tax=Variovorax sp. RT4R15 TaxID=3443737 RepID=UPI003F462AB4